MPWMYAPSPKATSLVTPSCSSPVASPGGAAPSSGEVSDPRAALVLRLLLQSAATIASPAAAAAALPYRTGSYGVTSSSSATTPT